MKLVVVWSVFKVIIEICTKGKKLFNKIQKLQGSALALMIFVPRLGSGHQHGFHTNVNSSTQ